MAGTTITIGVDWGVEKLAVCAVDAQGKRLYDKEIDRKGDAIEELVERMLKLADGEAEQLRVALEMPRAAVLDAFLERGVATFSLNRLSGSFLSSFSSSTGVYWSRNSSIDR